LFKQKTAYELFTCLEFRRVLFRSAPGRVPVDRGGSGRPGVRTSPVRPEAVMLPANVLRPTPATWESAYGDRAVPPGYGGRVLEEIGRASYRAARGGRVGREAATAT